MLTPAPQESDALVCLARIDETADATTFELATPAPRDFAYRPGQFIVLGVPIDGQIHHRAYSLSSSPTRPQRLAVTVKRVRGGRVSNWLLDHLHPSHRVLASPPAGQFHLREGALPATLVLVSAGSGITPMMSMVRYLADHEEVTEVHCLHCARTPDEMIFRHELECLAARHSWLHLHTHFSATEGRLDAPTVHRLLPRLDHAAAYLCGPESFMDSLSDWLHQLDLPSASLHRESFGMPRKTVASDPRYRVNVPQFGKSFTIGANETLLDALEREAMPILGACRSGVCGSCKCKVESGTVDSGGDASLIPPDEAQQGYVLACSTRARSDLIVGW